VILFRSARADRFPSGTIDDQFRLSRRRIETEDLSIYRPKSHPSNRKRPRALPSGIAA
jgi:hypothetical protein